MNIKKKIVGSLLIHGRGRTPDQIAAAYAITPDHARKVLAELEEDGTAISTQVGVTKLYRRADPHSPRHREGEQ